MSGPPWSYPDAAAAGPAAATSAAASAVCIYYVVIGGRFDKTKTKMKTKNTPSRIPPKYNPAHPKRSYYSDLISKNPILFSVFALVCCASLFFK